MPTAKQYRAAIEKSNAAILATPHIDKAAAFVNLKKTKENLKKSKFVGRCKALKLACLLLFVAAGTGVQAQKTPNTEVLQTCQPAEPIKNQCLAFGSVATDVYHIGKEGKRFRVYVNPNGRAFIIRNTNGKQRRDYTPKVCRSLIVGDWVTK